MKSIYDFPDVYDAVLRHSSEVIESEVKSICRLLTAAHGIRLEKAGYEVTGIDRSQAMFDGAQVRASDEGVELNLVEGDIRNFNLDEREFDCEIFMS